MSSVNFVEDVFLEFATAVDFGHISVQSQDLPAIRSFQTAVIVQRPFTKPQSLFVLKILQKYSVLAAMAGVELHDVVNSPIWKTPFRIIDLTKSIFVQENDLGGLEIYVKFPYSLKEQFDKSFPGMPSPWDQNKSARKIQLKDANVVALREFAVQHQIEIDEKFQELHDNIEEIWSQEEYIVPHSQIENNQAVLKNACEEAEEYFNSHKTNSLEQDLFLAKSMNFCLKTDKKNLSDIEKIATAKDNYFYTSQVSKVLSLYTSLNRPKIAVIVDRTSDVEEYTKHFVELADLEGIDRQDIRVCFRLSAEEENHKKFNSWIKDNNLNGPVAGGKIFIFSHKPAKWLFSTNEEIKIIITNSLFSSTSQTTSKWISSHPCVIFIGESKPSVRDQISKGKNVIQL
jgi:transcriptional regulator